jgi:hypothetical protein
LSRWGEGCPEPPADDVAFTFRRVAAEGDLIGGVEIDQFLSWAVRPGGLVSFLVRSGNDRAAFIERDGHLFDAYPRGGMVGGVELEMPGLPHVDVHGNRYMAAKIAGMPSGVFVNDELLIAGGEAPEVQLSPMVLRELSPDLFDLRIARRPLLYGREDENDALGIMEITPELERAEYILTVGDTLDGFTIESIDFSRRDEHHHDNGTRTFVVRNAGGAAVTADQYIEVQTGDVVDGFPLLDFHSPQVTGGDPVFIAAFSAGNGIFTAQQKMVATGDVFGGLEITQVFRHSVAEGVSAFTAQLDNGQTAVFRGGEVVAAPNGTVIEGSVVESIDAEFVRQNEAGQVAFVARLADRQPALIVATPDEGDWDHRVVAEEGGYSPETVFDLHQGYPHCPRELPTGGLYNCVATDAGIQTVLLDSSLILQEAGADAHAPLLVAELDPALFDIAPENYFVVAGSIVSGDAASIIRVHPSTGELHRAMYVGEQVGGIGRIDRIRYSPTDEGHVAANGDVAFVAENLFSGAEAVLSLGAPYVYTGQEIGLYTFNRFDDPHVNPSGVYYWSSFHHAEQGNGEGIFRVPGEVQCESGQVFDGVNSYVGFDTFSVQDDGDVAHIAVIQPPAGAPRRAVLVGSDILVEEGVSHLGGALVEEISPLAIRYAESGQVAFLADTASAPLALYVASPDGGGYTFRRVAALGDQMGEAAVSSFADFRLSDGGLTRFVSLGSAPAQFIETAEGVFTVISSGHTIEGYNFGPFREIRLMNDGLTSFVTGSTPQNTAAVRELSEGVFYAIEQGDEIGGLAIDFSFGEPFAPRFDPVGGELLRLPVDPVGLVVFVDGVPLAQQYTIDPDAPADMYITEAGKWETIAINDQGQFLTYGRLHAYDSESILSVDTVHRTVAEIASGGTWYEDFQADSFGLGGENTYGSDGVAVLSAEDRFGISAIVAPPALIAQHGDEVDGMALSHVVSPRRTEEGVIHYIGSEGVMEYRSEEVHHAVVLPGDLLAGQPLEFVDALTNNESGSIAMVTQLLGGRGVFVDDRPVAVSGISYIEERLVTHVGDASVEVISMNDSGQVAFTARAAGLPMALYVATPVGAFDSDRDNDVDLDDYDAFVACLGGPENGFSAACLIFDANKDCVVDLADMALLQNIIE